MLSKRPEKKMKDGPLSPADAVQTTDETGNDISFDFDSLQPDLKKVKRGKRRKLLIILAVVVLAAAAIFFVAKNLMGGQVQAGSAYTTTTVQKKDVTVTLSGSGNLKPANSYVVTSLLDGDIVSAPVEEGDVIQKDTLMYQIDCSDVSSSIEQAQNSLAESKSTYNSAVKAKDDLAIRSNAEGKVVELNVRAGDTIAAGTAIAKIRNSGVMRLKVPFEAEAAAALYVGQGAVVTLDGSFEKLTGTIAEKSSVDDVLPGNKIVRQVTFDVNNPGGISTTQTATAAVGSVTCTAGGTFTYKDEATVVSTVAGKIAQVSAAKGDSVTSGQVIVVLASDSIDDSIYKAEIAVKNAELALQSQSKKLNDYTIKSPISGTVVEKDYKQGDKVKSGKTLCTIFDLTYLTLTLNIDELDIGKVKIGQTVEIIADAVPGKTHQGVVTKVNINGTTTNGVTSYPVTVRIDKAEGLLPGMNVNAKLVVETLKDVLTVPVSAISRNNLLLVRTADGSAAGGTVSGTAAGGSAAGAKGAGQPGLPPGFEYREVTLGGSDKDLIVISDGVKEGDVVAIMNSAAAGPLNNAAANRGGGTETSQTSTDTGSPAKSTDSGSSSGSGGNEG